jgi:hypothetical protein
MKLTRKDIIALTIILLTIDVATNVKWILHKDTDHLPLVIVNLIVVLLLAGIVIYVKKKK